MAMSTGRVVALIQAMGGGADPAVIEAKVQDWLDNHPEATTTVQDGSITEQKLATSIAQKLGLISSLSDEIENKTLHALPMNSVEITNVSQLDKSVMLFSTNDIGGATATGTIISFAPSNASGEKSKLGSLQLWLRYSPGNIELYARKNVNSNWSAWFKLMTSADGLITNNIGMISLTANQTDITDANNFNNNRIVAGYQRDNIANAPTHFGTLICFSPLDASGVNSKNGNVQLWADYSNNHTLYYRHCFNNVWGDWKQLATINDVSDVVNSDWHPDMSMFENIGVIGDSFASGYMGVTSATKYEQSWPQVMARKHGISAYNYSYAGQTAKGWCTTDNRGLTAMLADPAKNLYIIALGLNDAYMLSQDATYLGSDADMSQNDYDQNPNTFYGCMGRIIRNIQVNKPNAKIVLVTTPYGTYNGHTGAVNRASDVSINNAIVTIAEHFSLPIIITLDNPLFYSTEYKSNILTYGSHPTATMYSAMANVYAEMIENAMVTYESYFANYNNQ